MGIAWGLSQHSDAFRARDAELRARGFAPIQARVALARHACRPRSRSSRRTRKPAARRRLISLPTQAAARDALLADSRKHRDRPSRR
jgi:hypothetical protein